MYLPSGFLLPAKLMLTRNTPQRPPAALRTRHARPKTGTWKTRQALQSEMDVKCRHTGCHRFLLSNFKYFLTLFSKFFSSFLHSTCSLSVSRSYLALDEIYHPLRVAIPNNSTLRMHVVRGGLRIKDGVLTLYDTLFQKIYTRATR